MSQYVSKKLIRKDARKFGLDPNVEVRQINLESGRRKHVTSSAGAVGPAQLLRSTARGLGVNPDDPQQNLLGGMKYMRQQLDRFHGDYRKALAAYNAGPGNVGAGLGYADKILGGRSPSSAPAAGGGGQSGTRTTPGVDRSGDRLAVLRDYLLNQSSHDTQGTALLGALGEIRGIKDTPSKTVRVSAPSGPTGGSGQQEGNYNIGRIQNRAKVIAGQHLPYQWGGGHAGKTPTNQAVPLDCSGAVSKVLGINPRVASQFIQWGQAGRDPKGGLTVWAKSSHVIVEINGRFWGTSGLRGPGKSTGAGWIPRKDIPKGYLSGFVARHPG